MRQCWLYSAKSRPTFFDILRDFEAEMSDKFHEMSFYFNQDVGDAASQSDDNECDATDNLETDHLTEPSRESHTDRHSSSCPDSSSPADQRDCLPPATSETDDITKLSASDVTDRLLAPSGGSDSTVVGGLSTWNGGDSSVAGLSTALDIDNIHRKDMLRNGHIPYNLVTTAARC